MGLFPMNVGGGGTGKTGVTISFANANCNIIDPRVDKGISIQFGGGATTVTLNGISYTVRLANGSMLQIGIKINKSGKYLALSNGNTPNQEQSLSEQSYTANTEIFFIYSSAGMQSGLLFIPN